MNVDVTGRGNAATDGERPRPWSTAERAFVTDRQGDWTALDALARTVQVRGFKALTADEVTRFPVLYRRVCSDLARAAAARYSHPLRASLEALTARSHAIVYASSDAYARGAAVSAGFRGSGDWATRLARALVAFPRAIDRHRVACLLALLLFAVPMIVGVYASIHDPAFAYRLMPESQLKPLQEAYNQGFSEGRPDGQGAAMTGFYIQHNVGIALRCLALGILGGVGSVITLIFNGLSIGAVLGYVTANGAGDNILTFVVGHSAFELGAIVLAGGAGMAFGWALVAPGERTRLASVQAIAPDIITIAVGCAAMLFCAACIEGFWSGSSVPSTVKRVVGVLNLFILCSYFFFGAREARRWERT